MSRIFLITFDGVPENRQAVTQFLDAQSEISDWHSSLINSVFVVTSLDAAALRDLMRAGPARRFIVVEVSSSGFNKNVSGILPRATWDFIRSRQPAG
jgi:hypothetical protein